MCTKQKERQRESEMGISTCINRCIIFTYTYTNTYTYMIYDYFMIYDL